MKQYADLKTRFSSVHDLMKFRVTEILLISTPYDGFVLEEDGQLSEQIYTQFSDLSIPFIPRITRVSNQEEVFAALETRPYHLIIAMSRISDLSSFDFEKAIKDAYPDIPIVMLSYDRLTDEMIARIRKNRCIDRVFYWSGDSKLLVAIIKYVEDWHNVAADSKQGVQVILIVDDSPMYYSQILPILYTEILTQTRYLVQHAMNTSHGRLRVRLRPKILLAETYEEAMAIILEYRQNLLGVISDVAFPKDGVINQVAGIELAHGVREMIAGFPFLLQSEQLENAEKAKEINVHFLNKNSPNLLHELRTFIMGNYGFGSFVFKYPDGTVIAEASDITNFEKLIRDLPDESLQYHALNNHFSRWFRARTEIEVAEKLRCVDAELFNVADIRTYMIDVLKAYFQRYQSGVILDFEGLTKKDMENAFIRLGTGSLGGKARGIAFINSLITKAQMTDKYEGIDIKVPRSFVICSDVFEKFLDENNLYEFTATTQDEAAIALKFMASDLPANIQKNLAVLAQSVTCPLAVRSSSLLEDSRVLPFAGIYKTYVVPNSHEDATIRLKQLSDAVKLVFASVFYTEPMQYAKNAGIRIEEEKMAVLIQELVGERYGDNYYPVISGVGQSYNYYPFHPMKPEDGTVSLALGLGKMVVSGEQVLRFSPSHPKMNPPYSGPEEYFDKSQKYFYALNLKASADVSLSADDNCTYEKLSISQAEEDKTLDYVGSTYSVEDEYIHDTVNQPGPKMVTFAPILKNNKLPLTNIIKDLLRLGKQSFGADVEIEFAVNIPKDRSRPKEFFFLQIRPMVVGREAVQVRIDESQEAWCTSNHTIGNGFYQNIHDIIFVDPETFVLKDSIEIAPEIGQLNHRLFQEGRRCILIGFGRMGTTDRWLGVPLSWSQMSQAQVIVEVDTKDLHPEPSLGSHFFHNLTSTQMGYFHIQYNDEKESRIDWDWLRNQPVLEATKRVRLIRREEPFLAKIDGRSFQGAIFK